MIQNRSHPLLDARAERDPAAGIGVAASVVGEGNQRLGDALRVEDGAHVGHRLHDEIAIAEQCDLVERVRGQRRDVDQVRDRRNAGCSD